MLAWTTFLPSAILLAPEKKGPTRTTTTVTTVGFIGCFFCGSSHRVNLIKKNGFSSDDEDLLLFWLKKSGSNLFCLFLTRRRSLETPWRSSNHGPDQSKSILDHPGAVSSARRYRKVHQLYVETHLLQIYLLKYSSPDCDHDVLMTWRNLRSKLHVYQVGPESLRLLVL